MNSNTEFRVALEALTHNEPHGEWQNTSSLRVTTQVFKK